MLFRILTYLFFFTLSNSPYSQGTEWKTYSLSGSALRTNDTAEMYETNDSGFVVALNARTNPDDNTIRGFVFKERGDSIIFNKSYLSNSGRTQLKSIVETSDAGLISCGSTKDDFDESLFVMRIDSLGNLLWGYTFEVAGRVKGEKILKSAIDGEFIIAGTIAGRLGFILINEDGEILQTKYIEELTGISFVDMISTDDSGFIITSSTDNLGIGTIDIVTIKLNSAFEIEWSKTYGWNSVINRGMNLTKSFDGGYIGVGQNDLTDDSGDMLIYKVDFEGNIEWSKTYQNTGGFQYSDIKPFIDSTYLIVTSSIKSGGGSYKTALIRIDASGDIIWSYLYADGTYHDDGCDFIVNEDSTVTLIAENGIVGYDNTLYMLNINKQGTIGCNQYSLDYIVKDSTLDMSSIILEFENSTLTFDDSTVIVVDETIIRETNCLCNNPPIVNITSHECITNTYFFDAEIISEGLIEEIIWDFGDESYSDLIAPSHVYDSAGVYNITLSVTDSAGCESIDMITVYINLDTLSFEIDNIGTAFNFWITSSLINYPDVLWDFGDGSTSTDIHPTHTYEEDGEYEICLTAFGHCDTSTICKTISLDFSGQQHEHISSLISIYPNPTSGTIFFDIGKSQKDFEVVITNILGQVVDHKLISNESTINFELSGTPGLYIVEIISNENEAARFKIMKQ